jgi:nucleoprotein TPR
LGFQYQYTSSSHAGGRGSETSFNKSILEDEAKSMDQLMEIIKYLKIEKAMLTKKVEVSQAEAIRLRGQMKSIQHQMAETQNALTVAQNKASQEMLLSAKYSHLLERVQTIPALRDSNRVAREERDHFKTKLEEVSL